MLWKNIASSLIQRGTLHKSPFANLPAADASLKSLRQLWLYLKMCAARSAQPGCQWCLALCFQSEFVSTRGA